eukprot:192648_1
MHTFGTSNKSQSEVTICRFNSPPPSLHSMHSTQSDYPLFDDTKAMHTVNAMDVLMVDFRIIALNSLWNRLVLVHSIMVCDITDERIHYKGTTRTAPTNSKLNGANCAHDVNRIGRSIYYGHTAPNLRKYPTYERHTPSYQLCIA